MKLNENLIREIIRFGTRAYPSIADPSESDLLSNAGAATVTAHLEKLALYELVKNVQPIFGKRGGMWIGYSLSEKGYSCGNDEAYFEEILASFEERPVNEVSESVNDLAGFCKNSNISANYKEDVVRTLEEISICFQHNCYIATISLCGKVLEFCLKEILYRNNIGFENMITLNNLIRIIKEQVPNEYIDPALENIARIILRSRNSAIHAGERIPVPSRDQAIMVIFAIRDVVTRNISHMPG